MATEKRWQPGDVVVLRDRLETRSTRAYEELLNDHTPNLWGWPWVVIKDTDDVVALYCPEGTKHRRWNIVEQSFREPLVTQGDSVRLLYPGKHYAVDAFYETGSGPPPHVRYYFMGAVPPFIPGKPIPGGLPEEDFVARGTRFYGWKVDIVAPFQRTEIGFDVCDEVLDIIVRSDRSYEWKDEEQMARFVSLGIYSQAEADRLRREGEEVINLIVQGRSPFDDEWTDWRPSPREAFIPEAPDGWQYLPLGESEWGAIHRRVLDGYRE
jgi:hypothetical protein